MIAKWGRESYFDCYFSLHQRPMVAPGHLAFHRRHWCSMATVFGEDVHNYHWEFNREMCVTRNDLVSYGLRKNPWYRRSVSKWKTAAGISSAGIASTGFKRLLACAPPAAPAVSCCKAVAGYARSAIDGVTVLDVTDSSHDNNGTIFTTGRVALRCMMRTELVVRNLVIRHRAHFATRDR